MLGPEDEHRNLAGPGLRVVTTGSAHAWVSTVWVGLASDGANSGSSRGVPGVGRAVRNRGG
ncbi:hypothetical protein AAW14_24105 [Streptomyces hygroscopicus]|nr:hypothetical protein [Streptomyces hygroscopicus]